jgi:hypothetical protein
LAPVAFVASTPNKPLDEQQKSPQPMSYTKKRRCVNCDGCFTNTFSGFFLSPKAKKNGTEPSKNPDLVPSIKTFRHCSKVVGSSKIAAAGCLDYAREKSPQRWPQRRNFSFA